MIHYLMILGTLFGALGLSQPLSAAQAVEDADIDDDQPDVFPDEDSVDMDTESDEDIIIMEEDEDSQ